jgi:hypothetical protein
MARTAAVVGTATATRNAVNRRQAEKNMAAYQNAAAATAPQQQVVYAAPPQEYAPPPQPEVIPAQAPAAQEDVITQLERLGALKAQGLLTEEEFAAQKAKLLGL